MGDSGRLSDILYTPLDKHDPPPGGEIMPVWCKTFQTSPSTVNMTVSCVVSGKSIVLVQIITVKFVLPMIATFAWYRIVGCQ